MTTPPKTEPPAFGTDLEPTEEMIARGAFGNGSYGNDTTAMSVVRAERRRLAIERKDRRREEYESLVVETLGDVATLQAELLKAGVKVAQKAVQTPEKLTKSELDILSRAQKAADQVSNRVLGLASRLDDKATHQDGLSFLIEGQEAGPEAPDDE